MGSMAGVVLSSSLLLLLLSACGTEGSSTITEPASVTAAQFARCLVDYSGGVLRLLGGGSGSKPINVSAVDGPSRPRGVRGLLPSCHKPVVRFTIASEVKVQNASLTFMDKLPCHPRSTRCRNATLYGMLKKISKPEEDASPEAISNKNKKLLFSIDKGTPSKPMNSNVRYEMEVGRLVVFNYGTPTVQRVVVCDYIRAHCPKNAAKIG